MPTLTDFQKANAPLAEELSGMDATTRLDVALHLVTAAWGNVCHELVIWEASTQPIGSWRELAECLQAVAMLSNVTATDLSRVVSGGPDTDLAAWQNEPVKITLLHAIIEVSKQLGLAHGYMADRLLEQNGVEYQALAPLIKALMDGLRLAARLLNVDMAGSVAATSIGK